MFKKLYELEKSIQPILASMEETGLVIAEDWISSGLEDKQNQLKNVNS